MASVALRPYDNARDRGFVVMSFVHSYGRSAYASGVPAAVLIDLLDPMLILWPTTVAEAPDGELLGWICGKPGAVGWVFVKPEYRRKKLGSALLAHAKAGKVIDTPFMPTKSIDGETSFHAMVKRLGYVVHFRPYLPLAEVSRLAGEKG